MCFKNFKKETDEEYDNVNYNKTLICFILMMSMNMYNNGLDSCR